MVAQRKAIERLYKGRCDVIIYEKAKDHISKITKSQESKVVVEQPCRVSFKSSPQASEGDGPSAVKQIIKLFIAPELIIKPGSKIIVTQEGRTIEYNASGPPAVYSSHQEIVLELFKGWA